MVKRQRKKSILLTHDQFRKLWEKLEKRYPTLLQDIGFRKDSTYETICGSISREIVNYLRKELGIEGRCMDGIYKGRGTEFSGTKRGGTSHCWVEFLVRLPKSKGTYGLDTWGLPKGAFKVIIDGAYAQFFDERITPRIIRDRVRLMIFMNDKTAEKWYSKGTELQDYEEELNKKINL